MNYSQRIAAAAAAVVCIFVAHLAPDGHHLTPENFSIKKKKLNWNKMKMIYSVFMPTDDDDVTISSYFL